MFAIYLFQTLQSTTQGLVRYVPGCYFYYRPRVIYNCNECTTETFRRRRDFYLMENISRSNL